MNLLPTAACVEWIRAQLPFSAMANPAYAVIAPDAVHVGAAPEVVFRLSARPHPKMPPESNTVFP